MLKVLVGLVTSGSNTPVTCSVFRPGECRCDNTGIGDSNRSRVYYFRVLSGNLPIAEEKSSELRRSVGRLGGKEGSEIKTIDLVEIASDPAFAVDEGLRVVAWNEGARMLLGYSTEEALGKKCGQILQALYTSGEPLCSSLCAGKSCMALGEKWSMAECRVRHKNGNMIPAGFSTLVVPKDARKPDNGDAVSVIFIRAPGTAESMEPQSQPLRIFALGHFALAVAGAGLDVDNWRRKQAATLLKILISHVGHPVHRDRLMEWLWPNTDPDRGWERLKVTVSCLRGKLRDGDFEREVIETVGKSYLLRRDAIWLDSDFFITLVSDGWDRLRAADMHEALTHFEEARDLCRGDYLEDEPYADWCAQERERLHEIYLEMLAGLAQCYGDQRKHSEAAQVCRTALFRDPCRESFIRCLMENLIALGRPDWAESQFHTWRRALSEEYGLEPTLETLQLHDQILNVRTSA